MYMSLECTLSIHHHTNDMLQNVSHTPQNAAAQSQSTEFSHPVTSPLSLALAGGWPYFTASPLFSPFIAVGKIILLAGRGPPSPQCVAPFCT